MPPKRATTAKTAESSKSKKVKQVKTTGRGHKATDIENEKDDINKVANLSSKSKKKGVEDHELEYLNMTVLDKLLTKSKESEPERLLREYKVASEKKNQDSDILIASLLSKVEELEKLNNDLSEQLKQRNVSNGEVAKKQSGKRVNGKIQSNDRNDVEALRKQNILYKDLIKEKDETIDELKVKLEESNASKEELEESCIFKDDFSFLICGLQIHETTTTDTYVIFDCTQTSPSGGMFVTYNFY